MGFLILFNFWGNRIPAIGFLFKCDIKYINLQGVNQYEKIT